MPVSLTSILAKEKYNRQGTLRLMGKHDRHRSVGEGMQDRVAKGLSDMSEVRWKVLGRHQHALSSGLLSKITSKLDVIYTEIV